MKSIFLDVVISYTSLTRFDWKFMIFSCRPYVAFRASTIHISQVSSETFVKILWSLTLEITRYEESGSHASKVKTLKIKVMFVTDSVTSYIPVMTYICVSVAILIVILWSLLIMYTELSSRRSVASYQICYNRLCNIPYTVMSQVPGQRHTSYRNGGNLLDSLNSGSVTMFADSGYIRHNNHW